MIHSMPVSDASKTGGHKRHKNRGLAVEQRRGDFLVQRRSPGRIVHITLVFDYHIMQYDACLHDFAQINLILVANWSLCYPPLDLQDAECLLSVFTRSLLSPSK